MIAIIKIINLIIYYSNLKQFMNFITYNYFRYDRYSYQSKHE